MQKSLSCSVRWHKVVFCFFKSYDDNNNVITRHSSQLVLVVLCFDGDRRTSDLNCRSDDKQLPLLFHLRAGGVAKILLSLDSISHSFHVRKQFG